MLLKRSWDLAACARKQSNFVTNAYLTNNNQIANSLFTSTINVSVSMVSSLSNEWYLLRIVHSIIKSNKYKIIKLVFSFFFLYLQSSGKHFFAFNFWLMLANLSTSHIMAWLWACITLILSVILLFFCGSFTLSFQIDFRSFSWKSVKDFFIPENLFFG